MNINQLVFAFLIATSILADSSPPLVFFAKIDNFFVPLSGEYLGDDHYELSVFSHGDRLASPVEFKMDDKYAYTTKHFRRMYVGIYNNALVFGPTIGATTLQFDSNRKLLKEPFYSCDVFDNHVRGIMHGETKVPSKYCFKVDIYLFDYDRRTRSAVLPVPPVPMIFCAKVNGILEPLSGMSLGKQFGDLKRFTYGNPLGVPAEFILSDNRAFTNDKFDREPVNVEKFMFGTGEKPTSLKLDSHKRVLNVPFYSCTSSDGKFHVILHEVPKIPKQICFKVDIYFLPYNQVDSPSYNPVHEGMPWYFFAKLNDTFEPLSGMYLGDQFDNVSLFIYGDNSSLPVKFTRKNGQTFTIQSTEQEYVGFYMGKFVFGPTMSSHTLKFNSNWRFLGGPFYSCDLMDRGVRGIVYSVPFALSSHCFEVDIYLLPYDRA